MTRRNCPLIASPKRASLFLVLVRAGSCQEFTQSPWRVIAPFGHAVVVERPLVPAPPAGGPALDWLDTGRDLSSRRYLLSARLAAGPPLVSVRVSVPGPGGLRGYHL